MILASTVSSRLYCIQTVTGKELRNREMAFLLVRSLITVVTGCALQLLPGAGFFPSDLCGFYCIRGK